MGSRFLTFTTETQSTYKMAPILENEIVVDDEPMSRTNQYRKIVKPMLERKRRARINACLDELKDIMVFAMQSEGESISKLEKADVLELTVKHLRKLKRQQMLALNPALDMDRFHAGYTTCATEVSRTLASTGVDISIGSGLMSHLGHKLNNIEHSRVAPLAIRVPEQRIPKHLRLPSPSSDAGYESGSEQPPSPSHLLTISPVWRPF